MKAARSRLLLAGWLQHKSSIFDSIARFDFFDGLLLCFSGPAAAFSTLK
jgi:hypothetical protein